MVNSFCSEWNFLSGAVYSNAVFKGWWETERSDGEVIALIHSELSEVLEALREGDPASTKIPDYSKVEEELADVVIRIMDWAVNNDYDVAGAILAKHAYNLNRPHKHGKLF